VRLFHDRSLFDHMTRTYPVARPRVDEATARGTTMGVEEEFLLVEPESGLPSMSAGAVLDRASVVAPH